MSEGTAEEVLAGAARWCVVEGDCLDVLPALPDKSVDHVVTDPPYGEHVHASVRSSGHATRSLFAGDGKAYQCNTRRTTDLEFAHLAPETAGHIAKQSARLLRRWFMAFSDVETCSLWRFVVTLSGLDYVRTMAWRRIGGAPQFTGDRPASGFETITLAHPKGRKRWNGGGKAGVYEFPIVANRLGERGTRVHPTQKPEELILALVADFTDPDDVILDPFAGSGTTGVAALRLGRRVILIEREPKWAELCRERMRAEDEGSTLAARRAGQVPMFG